MAATLPSWEGAFRRTLPFSLFRMRPTMFRHSGYSRAVSADIGEIDRRLRALEKTLTRAGGRASASAGQAADHLGETVANALSTIADRFRNGAGSMGDEAAKLGREGRRVG